MTIDKGTREAWQRHDKGFVLGETAQEFFANGLESLVAQLLESEFKREHALRWAKSGEDGIVYSYCLRCHGSDERREPTTDPRHAYKPATDPDSEWRGLAREELMKND